MLTRLYAGGQAVVGTRLINADVEVTGGVISAIRRRTENFFPSDLTSSAATQVIDCSGKVIAAGFIDLQCNGAFGRNITSDPSAIGPIAAGLPRFGITSWLPTVVTSPSRQRLAALDELAAMRSAATRRDQPIADPIGLHFEGPMISPDRLGAHDRRHRGVPESAELDRWIDTGALALVTLAPELPGALDMIRRLSNSGVVVGAGHTSMTPQDLAAARAAGLSYVTHLFNAMAPFNHRAPGPIGAVLADPTVVAGLIADGVHVDPVAVRMAWRSLGPMRLNLVSDAVSALGMPHGRLRAGRLQIDVDGTGVRTAAGVLAGSALALDQAVRNLIEWTDCTLAEAIATVTSVPADLLGLTDRGRLRVGSRADLVVLDENAALQSTIIGGATVWHAT